MKKIIKSTWTLLAIGLVFIAADLVVRAAGAAAPEPALRGDSDFRELSERVRLKGWSYFDYFHGNELEFDPADPGVGINRATVWEVHSQENAGES